MFIQKKGAKQVIQNGIYPYNVKGNTISVYSINYGIDENAVNTTQNLKYKTKKIASKVYNNYSENQKSCLSKHWQLTPLENLKNRVIQLDMLEESYRYMQGANKKNTINTQAATQNTLFK